MTACPLPKGRPHGSEAFGRSKPDQSDLEDGPGAAACPSGLSDTSDNDGFAPLGRTSIGRSAEPSRGRGTPRYHLQRALIRHVRLLIAVDRRRTFCDVLGSLHTENAFRLERLNDRRHSSPQLRSRHWLVDQVIGRFRTEHRTPSDFKPHQRAPSVSLTPQTPHASLSYRMYINVVRCVFRGEAYRSDTVGVLPRVPGGPVCVLLEAH